MRIRTLPTATVVVALALGYVGATAGINVQAAEKPKVDKPAAGKAGAAAPAGPKAAFQLDAFGPQPTDNVALKWSEQTLSLIRLAKPAPTVVSRALAVVQTSVYDAWAAYDPVADPTQPAPRLPAGQRTAGNKDTAINYAAYRSLLDLFPAQRELTRQFMVNLKENPDDASVTGDGPSAVGNRAAAAVLAVRHADGSNQLKEKGGTSPYADYAPLYAPVNGPETVSNTWRWQPLRLPNNTVQSFATPHWGRVRPFALTSAGQFPVPGPDLRKDYKKSLKEVVKYSGQLTDTDKAVAEYWSDGPTTELPPGHGAIFAGALCRMRGAHLDDDVKLLFLQANAVLDAGIAVWHYKREHDFVRPITLVRTLLNGEKIKSWGGPGKGIVHTTGDKWVPYQDPNFVTPPFAEYVSGHSAFTGATFQVLRAYTGTDQLNLSVTIKAGSSKIEPTITPAKDVRLSWRTMQDAADQAGLSREYGGIHFREGDLHGRDLGRKIGGVVHARAQTYFNGSARS